MKFHLAHTSVLLLLLKETSTADIAFEQLETPDPNGNESPILRIVERQRQAPLGSMFYVSHENDSHENDSHENDNQENDSQENDSHENDSHENNNQENNYQESNFQESNSQENDFHENDFHENNSQENDTQDLHESLGSQESHELQESSPVKSKWGYNDFLNILYVSSCAITIIVTLVASAYPYVKGDHTSASF